jgi:hypothetical protein
MSDEPFAQVLAALDKFQREIIERIGRLDVLINQPASASEKLPSSSVGSMFTEPERELLLVVAKWMLRLEGGAFRDMQGSLRPAERTDTERQLAILQALIERVAALKSTP